MTKKTEKFFHVVNIFTPPDIPTVQRIICAPDKEAAILKWAKYIFLRINDLKFENENQESCLVLSDIWNIDDAYQREDKSITSIFYIKEIVVEPKKELNKIFKSKKYKEFVDLVLLILKIKSDITFDEFSDERVHYQMKLFKAFGWQLNVDFVCRGTAIHTETGLVFWGADAYYAHEEMIMFFSNSIIERILAIRFGVKSEIEHNEDYIIGELAVLRFILGANIFPKIKLSSEAETSENI